MSEPAQSSNKNTRPTHRRIVERVVVCGALVLETPASFGKGDADAWTDMPLLADESDGRPLLPGSSIAGALRNYLRERVCGYEQESAGPNAETLLFGGRGGDEDGGQSQLIVHDALGQKDTYDYELRDGVKIDGPTRTAEDKKKFDMQLLSAGTKFALRFDLLVPDTAQRDELVRGLATALDGLGRGEIALGARKRRGFGRCRVHEWRVRQYEMKDRAQLLAWLAEGRGDESNPWTPPVAAAKDASITKLLGQEAIADQRDVFALHANFALEGSLMVRSGFGESDQGADMVHLHSKRVNQRGQVKATRRPILPGTSWAGALRARATRISHTLAHDESKVAPFIESLFGPEMGDEAKRSKTFQARASRLVIADSEITNGVRLQQTRIKIDRFTGGAFESALFSEEPIFGKPDTRLSLSVQVRQPKNADIGLVLLLLKDLWTGDLALGGESGVGRGRVQGRKATLKHHDKTWEIKQTDAGLSLSGSDWQELEDCLTALREELS